MKQKVFLFIFFVLICSRLFSQNLSEKLGGIKTNFKFYSDTTDLMVNNQFIIKYTEKFCHYEYIHKYDSQPFGYGGSYESYHLELSTNKFLSTEYIKNPEYDFKLTFYDKNNNILLTLNYSSFNNITYNIQQYNKAIIKGNSEIRFFSFDLINIPISLLDKTTKVSIIKIEDVKCKNN